MGLRELNYAWQLIGANTIKNLSEGPLCQTSQNLVLINLEEPELINSDVHIVLL
jgi:hypothetical protein